MLDYLAIGHITHDLTNDGGQLGGTVAYAALTARALGLQVGVVTAAAESFPMTALEGIAVHRASSDCTTTFDNRYERGRRVQTLRERARPLTFEDVPSDWRSAAIVHLAPVADEVDRALVRAFPDSFLCLTPQGWMRTWNERGQVERRAFVEARSSLVLAAATVVSLEDVGGDWSAVERWTDAPGALVVTQGEEGATVFFRGERRKFEARRVTVVDPTGAGDVFAACFFAQFWRTRDVWGAARLAVEIATDSVMKPGVAGVFADSASAHGRRNRRRHL